MRTGPWQLAAALVLVLGARAAGEPAAPDTGGPAAGPRPGLLFPILENDRWGFIDTTGAVVIPPRYESTVAVEAERRTGETLPRGSRPRPADLFMSPAVGPESTWAVPLKLDGRWGLVDQRGADVGVLRFDDMDAFGEGLAAGRLGKRWGFANEAGLMAIPPLFDAVGRFRGGLCLVDTSGKWGVIDPRGRFVVAPRFEFIKAADSVFHDNRAVVMFNGKRGYVSRSGSVAVPAVYDDAFRFSEGLAAVVKDGRTGYIDTTGHLVIAPRFDRGEPFDGGRALVTLGGLVGMIDRRGAFVVRPKYDEVESFSGREFALARRGDMLGTLARSGRWKVSYFEELLPIDDNLSVGKVQGRTGIVRRRTGTLVEAYPWEEIGAFSEGLAAVHDPGTKFGFIDPAGRLLIPQRFDEVGAFRHGVCRVAAGDTLGYIDRTGRWLWSERFAGYGNRPGG